MKNMNKSKISNAVLQKLFNHIWPVVRTQMRPCVDVWLCNAALADAVTTALVISAVETFRMMTGGRQEAALEELGGV